MTSVLIVTLISLRGVKESGQILAILNGILAFHEPQHTNAATTLSWMSTILGLLFLAITSEPAYNCLNHCKCAQGAIAYVASVSPIIL